MPLQDLYFFLLRSTSTSGTSTRKSCQALEHFNYWSSFTGHIPGPWACWVHWHRLKTRYVQDNIEIILATQFSKAKSHENWKSVSQSSTTTSEGGPALEIHLCLPGEPQADNKKATNTNWTSENQRVQTQCCKKSRKQITGQHDNLENICTSFNAARQRSC